MTTYLITRFSPTMQQVRTLGTFQIERRRRDAAWLQFNRAVDEMVRDGAGLDTQSGANAQREARAAVMPGPRERAVKVHYRNGFCQVEATTV